jgi:hypothetical protein
MIDLYECTYHLDLIDHCVTVRSRINVIQTKGDKRTNIHK